MADDRIPIIRFRDFILVSVQVEMTDRIVLKLKEDVTRTVVSSQVNGLILDLTGIDFMDSYISRALRDISVMAKLMGVPTVLCGMSPLIAMTLVDMGIGLAGVPMALNLDSAIRLLDQARKGSPAERDDQVQVTEQGDHDELWIVDE